ncbi:MAG: pentapeptide repeat-containing protein, partial [Campylobacterota bacterium]|nr:pentapeptide repeat-containing protein [Campylobacterota bacterium]
MLIQTKMFIAFFMIFILASCNDGNLSDNALSNKVLREHHITNGTIAHVDEHNIMVLTLEHKESEAHDNDLDMIGSDCYLFKPTKDLNSAVIDIDDMTHIGHLSIERLSSGEIVTFFTSDNASIFTFKSNEAYEYCVVHSGVAQENQTLFIRFEALQNKRVTRADQEAVNTLKLKKDCPGCDLDGADLSHLDLSGLDLSGAKMKDVNLYGADLTKADLNGTRIRGKADISHAAFNYTDINYENFSFSSIEGASFVGASFPQQDSGKYIFDPSIAYTDVDFTKANLSNLRMQEVKFTNCIFEDATFYNSSLYNSHFISSNMRNANFEGALIDSRTSFKNSNLIDVDIEILENSNANLKESIVTEKGDSKYLVRYEDFGMIKFYN